MEEHSKETGKFEKIKKLYRKVMLVFNLLVLGFYTVFTIVNISKDFESWHTKVMIVFLILHIVITLTISLLKFYGNKKYVSKLKDGMAIVGILKKGLNLLNLAMGVVAILSSLMIGEQASTYSLVVMVSSIALTTLQIAFSILKILFKKYMAKRVNSFKEKASDVKNNIKSKFKFFAKKSEDDEQQNLVNDLKNDNE